MVHRFEDERFVLVGEATMPDSVGAGKETVLAGEFDDSPGLDLVVTKEGKWAARIYLEPSGAPIFVGAPIFSDPLGTSHVLEDPVAVGPDADVLGLRRAAIGCDEVEATSNRPDTLRARQRAHAGYEVSIPARS